MSVSPMLAAPSSTHILHSPPGRSTSALPTPTPTTEILAMPLSTTDPSTSLNGGSISSLRAAALSTLRRKNNPPEPHPSGSRALVVDTLSRRNATQPSVILDYGTDDVPETSKRSLSPATIEPHQNSNLGHCDPETREEGEISDEEDNLSTSAASVQPAKFSPLPSDPQTPGNKTHQDSLLEKPDALLGKPPPDSYTVIVDEYHIRPGLQMTLPQYNSAKEIVLDLLGWGVHPEYLVDCGVSREIVYYVFTELRLKLPSNLDTDGLTPFQPNASFSGSTHLNLVSPSSSRLYNPSKSDVERHRTPTSAKFQQTFPPISPRTTRPYPSSIPRHEASLHDIEAQRRQELLARKAVLASRKPRSTQSSPIHPTQTDANSSSSPLHIHDRAGHHTPVVAAAVDDFLNSISEGPVNDTVARNGDPGFVEANGTPFGLGPPSQTPDSMDVDGERIPGLRSHEQLVKAASPTLTPPPLTEPSAATGPPISVDLVPTRPSSATLGSEYFSTNSTSTNDPSEPNTTTKLGPSINAADGPSTVPNSPKVQPTSTNGNGLQRRGTKRPVAADFVDAEPSTAPVQNIRANSFGSVQPPYLRRKMNTFASLTVPRKCVIDLSDSEDDTADGRARESEVPSSRPRPGPPLLPRPLTPSMSGKSPAGSGTVTPAALQEKEDEIKRMKEMIIQREQRLKKLNAQTQRTQGSTPLALSPAIKEEEDIYPRSGSSTGTDGDEAIAPDVIPTEEEDIRKGGNLGEQVVITETGQASTQENARALPVDAELTSQEISGEASLLEDHGPGPGGGEDTKFTTYDSLFATYPLLRSRSRVIMTEPLSRIGDATPELAKLLPDLRPLRVSVALRDTSRVLCHYEIPGGGQCRDPNCEDLHVGALEPSDEDAAQYLSEALGALMPYGEGELTTMLQSAKNRQLEDRVAEAVSTLDSRPSRGLL